MQPEECMDCGEEMVPGGAAHCLRHCERWFTWGPVERVMILHEDTGMVEAVQHRILADPTVAATVNDNWGIGLAGLLSKVKQFELTN